MNTSATITARIENLTPASQRLWGRMSVGQMLTHCADQLQIVMGEKAAAQQGNAVTRWLMKGLALYAPMPFPKNLRTIAELDPDKPLMTQPVDFVQDRAMLLALVTRLHQLPDSQLLAHPVFGSLTKAQAVKLTHIHLDHHLRQFGV
ncbi:DUF1569 domain-containing protein [Fibrella aquatilis]|uniref:DUF1569 domain-containing protein n=1 Tax=Fibrella aquatilis TaxID=2817059 RepID=A0A939G6V0_9BACT|nr:DUF1569 domain-containing protein [Fibrella aquatilis]MBO0933492.1 DUF1569 domain-containing protein [Fibrella aquatilis]